MVRSGPEVKVSTRFVTSNKTLTNFQVRWNILEQIIRIHKFKVPFPNKCSLEQWELPWKRTKCITFMWSNLRDSIYCILYTMWDKTSIWTKIDLESDLLCSNCLLQRDFVHMTKAFCEWTPSPVRVMMPVPTIHG